MQNKVLEKFNEFITTINGDERVCGYLLEMLGCYNGDDQDQLADTIAEFEDHLTDTLKEKLTSVENPEEINLGLKFGLVLSTEKESLALNIEGDLSVVKLMGEYEYCLELYGADSFVIIPTEIFKDEPCKAWFISIYESLGVEGIEEEDNFEEEDEEVF